MKPKIDINFKCNQNKLWVLDTRQWCSQDVVWRPLVLGVICYNKDVLLVILLLLFNYCMIFLVSILDYVLLNSIFGR